MVLATPRRSRRRGRRRLRPGRARSPLRPPKVLSRKNHPGCGTSRRRLWGAQPPRLSFAAPSRQTLRANRRLSPWFWQRRAVADDEGVVGCARGGRAPRCAREKFYQAKTTPAAARPGAGFGEHSRPGCRWPRPRGGLFARTDDFRHGFGNAAPWPTTRASSAAPGAGALPVAPAQSLIQKKPPRLRHVPAHPAHPARGSQPRPGRNLCRNRSPKHIPAPSGAASSGPCGRHHVAPDGAEFILHLVLLRLRP